HTRHDDRVSEWTTWRWGHRVGLSLIPFRLLLEIAEDLLLALRAQPLCGLELIQRLTVLEASAGRAATTAAQHICFVEEDDHAAVPQRELAKLAVKELDLHRGDTDEGLYERRRIDEDVRLAGLAGRRLRHQGFAGGRRGPQQDSARHVAAAVFDLLRPLQEVEVLLDPPHDVVLAPDVAEAGLDLAGLERLDTADEEDAEEEHDVDEAAERAEGDGQSDRQADRRVEEDVAEPPRRRLGQRLDRPDPPHPRQEQTDHRKDGEALHQTRQPEPRVRLHLAHLPFPAAEDLLLPEGVVALRVLGDEVVDLADDLQTEQDHDPPLGAQLVAEGLTPRHQRDLRLLFGGAQQEDDRQQDQHLDAIHEEHLRSQLWLAIVDDRLVHRRHGRHEGGAVHTHVESSSAGRSSVWRMVI